ncbi:MAG: class I SAM-dependent methyltransferase [Thermoanaerobaculia bacterium]
MTGARRPRSWRDAKTQHERPHHAARPARGRRKAERAGLAVRFDLGSGTDFPYASGSLDRRLSTLMFHHLRADERPRMPAEAHRVLKPGGRLERFDFGGAATLPDALPIAPRAPHEVAVPEATAKP